MRSFRGAAPRGGCAAAGTHGLTPRAGRSPAAACGPYESRQYPGSVRRIAAAATSSDGSRQAKGDAGSAQRFVIPAGRQRLLEGALDGGLQPAVVEDGHLHKLPALVDHRSRNLLRRIPTAKALSDVHACRTAHEAQQAASRVAQAVILPPFPGVSWSRSCRFGRLLPQ